jgi:hypothetical protein
MRNAFLLAAACTVITTQATTWQLDFGPAVGGFGLNGANERPTPVSTPATGREIQDYNSPNFMRYDDVLNRIELHLGWGSVSEVGGTDLTGAFRGMHIHGPADVNNAAGILYGLASWDGVGDPNADAVVMPSLETSDSLIISSGTTPGVHDAGLFDITFDLIDNPNGTTFTIAQQEAQLLGGNWYLNIHSSTFPGGEIRGQLLAIPEPHHYAMMAGLGLLGFAGYRRFRTARA